MSLGILGNFLFDCDVLLLYSVGKGGLKVYCYQKYRHCTFFTLTSFKQSKYLFVQKRKFASLNTSCWPLPSWNYHHLVDRTCLVYLICILICWYTIYQYIFTASRDGGVEDSAMDYGLGC